MTTERLPQLVVDVHSAEPVLRELCYSYWRQNETGAFVHTVKLLSEHYKIPAHRVSEQVASASVAYCLDEVCSRGCGRPLPYLSRADYQQRRRYRFANGVCTECLATERQRQAEEQRRAAAEREAREATVAAMLSAEYANACNSHSNVLDWTLRDAVFFAALVRGGATEDLSCIRPLEEMDPPFTPTPDFDRESVVPLYTQNLIRIHARTPRGTAFPDPESDGYRFYSSKVWWVIPHPDNLPVRRVVDSVEHLLADSARWPDEWFFEVKVLREELALQECLQYLRLVMDDRGFNQPIGDKTKTVLKLVLQHFSIAQAYNFMWGAGMSAADYMVRENITRPHAANTIPGGIQRRMEKALVHKYDVKPYGRDHRAPQSHASHVLFTTALRLPGGGLQAIHGSDDGRT